MQFQDWRPISPICADELLGCICMVPLMYTDMRTQLSSRVFCTDASEFGGGACETIGLTTAGVAAGREEAVRAGSSSSGKSSRRNRGQGVGARAPQASRPQGHRCANRFAVALPTRRMASDPDLPAKMALESHFEFSLEELRRAHQ